MSPTGRNLRLTLALVLAVVSIAVYWGSFDNEFVWDDPIVFERQLPYFDDLADVFFPPPQIPQFGEHYYRPLGVASYLVDEWIARTFWPEAERLEARRLVYHASPVAYHAAATLLVFAVGLALLRLRPGGTPAGAPLVAAAGALLFAVHPIHVESVAWMAGRSDVLCGIFFLAAVLALLRYRRDANPVFLLFAAAATLASLLTKETGLGVVLFAVLLVVLVPHGTGAEEPARTETRVERRRREREGRRPAAAARGSAPLPLIVELGVLGGAVVIYFALRAAALDTAGSPALARTPEYGRFFPALGWYLVKSFWPPPQSAFVAHVPGIPAGLLGFGAAAAFGLAVVVALRGRLAGARPELLAAGLFFASLAPSLMIALYQISETPLAERYLYIPSAGLLLLLGFLLARPLRSAAERPERPFLLLVVPLVAVPLALATVRRAEVWNDNLAFWTDAVEKAPGEGLPHLHLGIEFAEKQRFAESEEQYRLALRTYRDAEGLSKAHNNLGSLLLRIGRYDDAIEQFQLALKQDPNYETPHYNWALALLNKTGAAGSDLVERERLVREAVSHFQQALSINPRYVKAHLQFGALLVRLGEAGRGTPHLKRVLELSPGSNEAREAQATLASIKPM